MRQRKSKTNGKYYPTLGKRGMMQDLPLSNKRSSETWQDYKDSQIFVKNLRESINIDLLSF